MDALRSEVGWTSQMKQFLLIEDLRPILWFSMVPNCLTLLWGITSQGISSCGTPEQMTILCDLQTVKPTTLLNALQSRWYAPINVHVAVEKSKGSKYLKLGIVNFEVEND